MRLLKKIVPFMLVLVKMITMLPTTAYAHGHSNGHGNGVGHTNSNGVGHTDNHGNNGNNSNNGNNENSGSTENTDSTDSTENNEGSDSNRNDIDMNDAVASEETTNIEEEEVPLAELTVLNTEDHFAYISGYSDGTIRPNATITRAEIAVIFYRLLSDEFRAICWTNENDFNDVPADKWYNTAISTVVNAGIIGGYEDDTFKPEKKITRAEFAAIAAGFVGESYEGENLFTDIEEHWAAEYSENN